MNAGEPSYQPFVELGPPDFTAPFVDGVVECFTGDIASRGLIIYHHVLRVRDADGVPILWLCAESSLLGGEAVFLGRFWHGGHATLARDPSLADPTVFFPRAMREAMAMLGVEPAS